MDFCNKQSFSPCQAFPAQSNLVSTRSTFQVLHIMVGSWPYPQTLGYAGKA